MSRLRWPRVSWSKCLLRDDQPYLFTTAQWTLGNNKELAFRVPVPFLAYRVVLALFVLSNYIGNLATHDKDSLPYFLIYLTNWGITMVLLWTLLETYITAWEYYKQRQDPMHRIHTMPFTYQATWAVFNLVASLAIFISLFYWIILFDSESASYMNVFVHGLNSVFVVVDIFVSARPVRIHHYYIPFAFGLIYVIFSGIYYAAGGTDADGNRYIYEPLDWSKPGATIGVVIGGAVGLFVIHAGLVYGFYRLRIFIWDEFLGHSPYVEGGEPFWNSQMTTTAAAADPASRATPKSVDRHVALSLTAASAKVDSVYSRYAKELEDSSSQASSSSSEQEEEVREAPERQRY